MTSKHRYDEFGGNYFEPGFEYVEPGFSVEEELNRREGPFLELGGPTESGYYHLDGVQMKKRIIVSNVGDAVIRAYNPEYADELIGKTDIDINGTDINFPDGSLGAVFASHIPYLHDIEDYGDDEILRKARGASRQARKEGVVDVRHTDASLRLKIADEVYRTLEPGGLYFTDGMTNEMHAFSVMGYELKALYDRDKRFPYFYAVLQKPLEEPATIPVA